MAGNYDPGFDPDHPDPNDPLYYPDAPPAESPQINAPGTPGTPGTTTPVKKTGAPTPADWATATAGLHGGERDLATSNEVVRRLQAMGYTAELAPPDAQGRSQGMLFDGVLHRTLDSSDNWTMVSNADGKAWGTDAGTAGGGVDPTYLQPYAKTFAEFYPGAAGATGGLDNPTFHAPGAFVAPTAGSILQDPSYQFREGRLKGAIENGAASRGLINSGGTIDAILNNVGNFASQEYGNIWNRDFNKWGADWQHAGDQFSAESTTSNTNFDRAWKQYLEDKDTFYKNQSNPFDKITRTAGIGAQVSV